MKTLYIQRHAKAVKSGYEHDFSRDLRPKGLEEAHQVGRFLKRHGLLADRLLTSPANRAVQTAKAVAEHTGERPVTESQLYDGGWEALLEVLRFQEDALGTIRLVGHNPDLEALCEYLCGIRPGGIHLATGSVVCIQCAVDCWRQLDAGTGVLEWVVRPGHLIL